MFLSRFVESGRVLCASVAHKTVHRTEVRGRGPFSRWNEHQGDNNNNNNNRPLGQDDVPPSVRDDTPGGVVGCRPSRRMSRLKRKKSNGKRDLIMRNARELLAIAFESCLALKIDVGAQKVRHQARVAVQKTRAPRGKVSKFQVWPARGISVVHSRRQVDFDSRASLFSGVIIGRVRLDVGAAIANHNTCPGAFIRVVLRGNRNLAEDSLRASGREN
ncbi:Hypothetical predicted protein [Olea europaea subsp. europaea]|uniref:Uncharacterized protein n=1 Tax=Olea europaea subsp. europaea TaxID=158383 RepID=A0A8S0TMD4_OLEEU|nr:Hypothetical predicted protein [Olea europaea subsp. europaea]